jgi:putative flippase GtrA
LTHDNERGKEGRNVTTLTITQPVFPRLPRPDGRFVRQLVRYGVVGVFGTAVSALLYLVFRTWWDAVRRDYVQNAGTVAFYAVYSSAVLLVLGAVVTDPTALQESSAVAMASVLGGVMRFVVLRNWVFGSRAAVPGSST